MNDNILSQEEVNALLESVEQGNLQPAKTDAPQKSDSGIVPYDLTSRDRIIRDRMPSLEMVHVRFARLLRTSLSALLRRVVDAHVLSTEMVKFGDFMYAIPLPTSLNLFRLKPLPGLAMLTLDAKLVYALVESFCGGGRGMPFPQAAPRDFTPIENQVLRKVVGLTLRDLEDSWQPVYTVETEFVQAEVNPQFITLVPSTDLTVVVSLEIDLSQTSGEMTLCVPYSTIEPIRSKLSSALQNENVNHDPEWTRRLRETLLDTTVELVVELGKTQVLVNDLMRLRVGDVIPLHRDVHDPMDLFVQGIPKFKAVPGVCRGNQAVQVLRALPSLKV